jgi:hypothetical protein
MLLALNVANQPTPPEQYPILRVVAAFPLAADFNSSAQQVQLALEEDSHPLALLSRNALASVLATTPEGKSIVTQLRHTLKRTRGQAVTDDEDHEDHARPSKQKRSTKRRSTKRRR